MVLTSFHSRLGYSRSWPSAIPGSASTERDFLGELIAAAKAKGLHVLLYMTDDPQWHGGRRATKQLDSAAYSAYKGKEVDLTTGRASASTATTTFRRGHGPTTRTWPGFWIDNDNEYWEQKRAVRADQKARRPSFLLSKQQ